MLLTLFQIIWVFATLVIPVPAIYVTLRYLSGKIPRHYETIPFTDGVTVAERGLFVEEFATKYAPAIVQPPELGETPEVCLFEVVEQEETYTINYWVSWDDENHPNHLVDELYRIIRNAYYGGKTTKDIEHVQITVSQKTGHVTKIMYRTDPRNRADVFFPRRTRAIIKQTNSNYVCIVGDTEQQVDPVFLDSSRVKLAVQTWNHLFTLTEAGTPLEIPLLWLDAKLYKDLKITRRRGGKKTLRDWIITLTIIIMIIVGWTVLTL